MTKIVFHPTALRPRGDDELVAAVRAGDDRAFATIVTRFEPALPAYARQVLGGAHHDAEECVQDVFASGRRSSCTSSRAPRTPASPSTSASAPAPPRRSSAARAAP